MRKVISFLLLLTFLLGLCSTAFAIYCTDCGKQYNSEFHYCPFCGVKNAKPSSSSPGTSSGSSGSSSSGQSSSGSSSGSSSSSSSKATAKPTATPAPTAKPSALEVTSVSNQGSGQVKISWTDSSFNGPYTVCYMVNMSGDFDTDYDTTTGLWTVAKDVTGTSTTTNKLIPGQDCWIVVFDNDDNYTVYDYNAPAYNHFPEFGTDISIQLKTRTGTSYHEYDAFSSADIASNSGSKAYGAYIRLNYPQLAKARLYDCMVTITSPRGETIVDTITDMELSSGRSYTYWNFFSFDWYFNILTKYYGKVEPGTYTWTMFYDGMFVNSQTFRIKD